jgi:hypothetical protein
MNTNIEIPMPPLNVVIDLTLEEEDEAGFEFHEEAPSTKLIPKFMANDLTVAARMVQTNWWYLCDREKLPADTFNYVNETYQKALDWIIGTVENGRLATLQPQDIFALGDVGDFLGLTRQGHLYIEQFLSHLEEYIRMDPNGEEFLRLKLHYERVAERLTWHSV